MSKVRKGKKKKKSGFMEDGRGNKLLGLFLIALALLLLFAFISNLFTWREDFNLVKLSSSEYLLGGSYESSNFMGKLGALLSHKLMYNGIGIMAFILVYLLGKTGLLVLFGGSRLGMWSEWKWSAYLTVFMSVFLAFAFSSIEFNIGGNIGVGIKSFFVSLIGAVGLSLLFILLLGLIIIWLFNPDFNDVSFRSILGGHKNTLSRIFPFLSIGSKRNKDKNPEVGQRKAVTEEKGGDVDYNDFVLADDKIVQPSSETAGQNNAPKEKDLFTVQKEANLDDFQIIGPGESTDNTTFSKTKEEEFSNLNKHAEKLIVEKENEEHLEPYDPTRDLSDYKYPPIEILKEVGAKNIHFDREELKEKKDQIVKTLSHYNIKITNIKATVGPTVTLYEIIPAPGVKISKIKNLEDDIALSLSALGIRIIAPIPGKGTIGIEVPNKKRQMVGLRELLESPKFRDAKMDLPIALGKTISAEVFIADLAKMPHLLVAGATGQGKSVGINTILASLLYKKHPSQIKLVLIDPKKVELSIYGEIENHFLAYLPDSEEPIITETRKVINTLNSLCIEMDDRYNLLKKGRVRNIKEYNTKFMARRLNPEKGHKFLPFIVLVIDEFADLIMTAGKEIELPIGRLAQLARAVGIHLIIATQRPSVNIITGIIKANFPARLAFKVTSKVDSRTILDTGGADQLVGMGDMLLSVGGKMIRLQCAFIDTPEVEELVDFIAEQKAFPQPYFLPEYKGEDEDDSSSRANITLSELDDFFDESAGMVVGTQSGSTSMLQRKMKLGYNRAGRIMDQLEHFGIVGPARGSKPREVLISDEMELANHIRAIRNMED